MTNLLLIVANVLEIFFCWYQVSQMNPERKISSVLIFVKSIKIHKIREN